MISVIVPVYNVEKYLPKCIESIMNQTYQDLEIILVNDGSSDNSNRICVRYAKIDKRIKVVNKENGGVSSARNLGLDIANGEYISFIDSDDYIELNMYEKMIDIALKKDIDIVSCNYNHLKNDGIKVPFFSLDKDEYIEDKNILFEKIFQYKNYDLILFNKLYKRYIWKDLRFPLNINLAEDLMVLYPTINIAHKFYCLKDSLYNKLERIDGLTNSIKIEDYINNVKAHEQFLLDVSNNEDLDYKRIFSACLDNLFRHYKHLLDIIYLLDNNKYKDLELEIIDKICGLYRNSDLSKKDKKKISFLKYSPAIYKRYRILSNKWKKYRDKF